MKVAINRRARHGISVPTPEPDSARAAAQPEMLSTASWHAFGQAVGLSCGASADAMVGSERAPPADVAAVAALRQSMSRDGYVQVEPAQWVGDGGSEQLQRWTASFSDAIDKLDAAGLPAVFLLAFDEVWACVDRLRWTLEGALGHGLTFDFYVSAAMEGSSLRRRGHAVAYSRASHPRPRCHPRCLPDPHPCAHPRTQRPPTRLCM